jgi:hypothetical protein
VGHLPLGCGRTSTPFSVPRLSNEAGDVDGLNHVAQFCSPISDENAAPGHQKDASDAGRGGHGELGSARPLQNVAVAGPVRQLPGRAHGGNRLQRCVGRWRRCLNNRRR